MGESLKNCRGCFKFIAANEPKQCKLSKKINNSEVTVAEFLSGITGLCFEASKDVICGSCKHSVMTSFGFRQQIIETDEKFRILTTRVKVEVSQLPEQGPVVHVPEQVKVEDLDIKMEEFCEPEPQIFIPSTKLGRPKKGQKRENIPIRRGRLPQRKLNLEKYKRNAEGLYECPKENCPGLFKRIGGLEIHLDNKHPENTSFKCDICSEEFHARLLVSRHVLQVHTPRPFICDICGNSYYDHTGIKQHMKVHLPKKENGTPYPCPICGLFYTSRQGVARHRQRKHPSCPKELLAKPFKCDVCGAQWATNAELRKHMEYHDDPKYFCHFCGKGFTTKGSLTLHLHRHTNYRPKTCDICGKGFLTNYIFENHMRTHTDERPFKCKKCPATCKTQNTLYTHVMWQHSNGGAVNCELCGKIFKNKLTLQQHVLRAHSTRDLQCPHCDKSYKILHSLQAHIQNIHYGFKKRHECTICLKNLFSKAHVVEHVQHTHEIAQGKTAEDYVKAFWTSDPAGANLGEVKPTPYQPNETMNEIMS